MPRRYVLFAVLAFLVPTAALTAFDFSIGRGIDWAGNILPGLWFAFAALMLGYHRHGRHRTRR